MKIIIQTIPHSLQRYDTIGDWYTTKDGTVHIMVSHLGNWRPEFLIAIHEFTEAFACLQDGVAEESVDKFDKEFLDPEMEPGDSAHAPYQRQHCLATGVERILAAYFGIQWEVYENLLEQVQERAKKEKEDAENRSSETPEAL